MLNYSSNIKSRSLLKSNNKENQQTDQIEIKAKSCNTLDDGIKDAIKTATRKNRSKQKINETDISKVVRFVSKQISASIELSSENKLAICSLYFVMTWFTDVLLYVPYLLIFSDVPGAGKSTFIEVAENLVYNPKTLSSFTRASLNIEASNNECTFLLDESDNAPLNQRDMIAILNSGNNRRAGGSLRAAKDEHGNYTKSIKTHAFGPKIIAGLNKDYPNTLIDRCLAVKIEVAKSHQYLDVYQRPAPKSYSKFHVFMKKFAEANKGKLLKILHKDICPSHEVFKNRSSDKFKPLFALIELSEDEKFKRIWRNRVIKYATSGEYKDKYQSLSDRFAETVENLLKEAKIQGEYVTTKELCDLLNAQPAEFKKEFANGFDFTGRKISCLLKPLDIRPTKFPPSNHRGYRVEDFS